MSESLPGKLFRQEVVLAQRHARLWGELTVPVTPARWLLILAATLTLVFLFALAKFGHYTRAEKVAGYLKPSAGEVRLLSDQNAIIKQQLVAVGDIVEIGQPLLLVAALKDPDHDPQIIAELEAFITHIDSSLDILGRDHGREEVHLKADIRGYESQLLALEAEVATQERQKSLAKARLARGISLEVEGFLATQEKEGMEQDVLRLDQAFSALKRNKSAMQQQLAQARFRLSGLADQYEEESLRLRRERSRQKREQLRYLRQAGRTLLAQRAGEVTAINVYPGSTIETGQTLIVITPEEGNMEAVLFLPPKGSGFVNSGQKVQLRINAFPHEQFGTLQGRIVEYTRAVLLPGELSEHIKRNGPMYRIKVALETQHLGGFRLRSGMDVEATISLERRAIWEWMVAPVLRWRQRVIL